MPSSLRYRSRLRALACGITLSGFGLVAGAQTLEWSSGFEKGFPGTDWLDWQDGSFSPNGTMPVQRVAAWTIVHRDSGEPVFAGQHAYKGWIAGPATQGEHRAYPVIHADVETPVVNTFMVYLDIDYQALSREDWIHIATWGNHDPKSGSGRWALHTLSVRDRRLEFAHTAPFGGTYLGSSPQASFPLRRWVRLTAYIHYRGNDGFVQLWQDGIPTLRAEIPYLKQHPGTRLRTAHWGMYASGGVSRAIQYNDEVSLCRLREPLTDLRTEPRCPMHR